MTSNERTPRDGKNRLATESSPYLRQHAGNPVDWFPWGEEAFARARSENRPIFLSIGYSTCYWCHVMERESFADPEVADRMRRTVVAVKVDREERPDLDGIYMTSVMLMAGHGGWPMSVFLTPDRKPFFGATYIPKERFLDLLDAVHAAWTNRTRQVLEEADRVADAVRTASGIPEASSAALPEPALIEVAARRFGGMFDPDHAGFGSAPKFPQPAILELLMSRVEMTKDRSALSMVTRTLDAMWMGGIHDQVGGGFHRYSTDAHWRVPHFEKMLYDQAQLLHAYARAFRLTLRPEYRRVCVQIAEYLEREMTGAEGLFHSAQDSEVEETEGKSYLWTPEELRNALDREEFALAARVYGIGSAPAFEGRHILHWTESCGTVADGTGMTLPELFGHIDAIREKLLAVRLSRPRPFLDDKAITSWNGLMIEALAYAGRVLQEGRFLPLASRAAEALLSTLRGPDGRLLHVARAGQARIPAYLDDYGAAILALLEMHRATGDLRWERESERLGNAMVKTLREPSGRFRYADPSIGFLIAETRDLSDGAFPSGSGLAVRALTGLAGIGHPEYAPVAADLLRAFAPLLRSHPASLPYMLWGLYEFQAGNAAEPAPGARETIPPSTGEILRAEGALFPDRVAPGEPVEVSVTLWIREGWHIQANPASLDFLVPTTLTASVEGRATSFAPRYPPGSMIPIAPGNGPVSVYENQVVLEGTLRIDGAGSETGSGVVTVSIMAQGCDATGRCLAASTIEVGLPFEYGR